MIGSISFLLFAMARYHDRYLRMNCTLRVPLVNAKQMLLVYYCICTRWMCEILHCCDPSFKISYFRHDTVTTSVVREYLLYLQWHYLDYMSAKNYLVYISVIISVIEFKTVLLFLCFSLSVKFCHLQVNYYYDRLRGISTALT